MLSRRRHVHALIREQHGNDGRLLLGCKVLGSLVSQRIVHEDFGDCRDSRVPVRAVRLERSPDPRPSHLRPAPHRRECGKLFHVVRRRARVRRGSLRVLGWRQVEVFRGWHAVHGRLLPEAEHAQLDRLARAVRLDPSVVRAHVEARAPRLRPVRVGLLKQDALVLLHCGEVVPLVLVRVPGGQRVLDHAVPRAKQIFRDVVVRLHRGPLVHHGKVVVLDRVLADVAPRVQVQVALVAGFLVGVGSVTRFEL
mmetsp:Transcript_12367/g.29990  ORF Transcript_12367/g.29990 Transcript_12367/m.29990 type:complete len:252 (+) Transcript_12367:1287-2042(+)